VSGGGQLFLYLQLVILRLTDNLRGADYSRIAQNNQIFYCMSGIFCASYYFLDLHKAKLEADCRFTGVGNV
jgi:hypothetical protein